MGLSILISSTYAIKGVLGLSGFLVLQLDTRANAFSNFFCHFLRDSKAYHIVPLQGHPRALGMWRSSAMAEIPSGRLALLEFSEISAFDSTIFKCLSYLSRQLIRMRMTVTALAIKVELLVCWFVIMFSRLRGLVHW
jgi:hypothetical protein